MSLSRNKYQLAFSAFLLSVVLVFFYLRPLSSQWDRIINGDGLGYYAYLPAQFIYHDQEYHFKWFNAVYEKYYAPGTFTNPEDNFIVHYGNHKINKYYAGLSYLWLPFFATGHLAAKLCNYPADGFSQPYQLAIAIASLFWLLLGLIVLRKLLLSLLENPFVACLVPVLLFYGTYLFNYSIYFNALSHVYSFSLCVCFVYFLRKFFRREEQQLRNFLLCALYLVLSVCVRPLNMILLLFIPVFYEAGAFKHFSLKLKPFYFLLLLLIIGAILYQLRITWQQTGTLFPDTYTGETFHFSRNIFGDALFSYRVGLFVYAPLILLSFFGVFFMPLRKGALLAILFLAILFLYSSWWYWPIVKRALVDFYVIPAVLLAALINGLHSLKRTVLFALSGLSVIFFQFKNYQMRQGILDEFYTYKEVFWRNFFRLQKANMFLVDPSTILAEKTEKQDFEAPSFSGNKNTEKKHEGNYSLLFDNQNYISDVLSVPFPNLFAKAGNRKIRVSFWMYAEPGIQQVHVFVKFMDKHDKLIEEVPFYMNKESIFDSTWDYKEFGVELADKKELVYERVGTVTLTVWNVNTKEKFYLDDAKIEFLLTDPAHETFE